MRNSEWNNMNPEVTKRRWILFLLFLIPMPVFPMDYRAGMVLDQQFTVENNYFDSISGNFDQDESYNVIALSPDLLLSTGNHLSLYLLADLSWIHTWGDELTDEDQLDAEFINAYLTIRHNTLKADLGIQTLSLGNGYIMESEEPGITLKYPIHNRLSCLLEAAGIMDASPIASVSIEYKTGFLEHVRVFGAWYQDRDNAFADMFNYQDRILTDWWLSTKNYQLWLLNQNDLLNAATSEADLFWYGLSGNFFVADIFVSGIMMIESGSGSIVFEYPIRLIPLEYDSRTWNFNVSSYLADLDFSYTVDDRLAVTAFVFISGGFDSGQNKIDTFVSPMPRNDRTAIFFSPCFSNQIEEDFLSKGGVYWAGVIAPGIKIDYDLSERWSSDLTLATFFPEDPPSSERDWYGWEADAGLSYTFHEKYKIFCEAALFQHGNVYQYDGKTPDPATRFMVGVNGFF